MTAREVATADWQKAATALLSEGFFALTAVQRSPNAAVEVWLRTVAGTEFFTVLTDNNLPSLAGLWPEAEIYEARLIRDFGLVAMGNGILRKEVLLQRRQADGWPGLKDPTDKAGSPSRRRSLPPGVVQ